jgi:hypothetical protein
MSIPFAAESRLAVSAWLPAWQDDLHHANAHEGVGHCTGWAMTGGKGAMAGSFHATQAAYYGSNNFLWQRIHCQLVGQPGMPLAAGLSH